jgi:hypothetical protein
LKLSPVKFCDAFVLLKHRQRLFEQVVKVQRVRRLLLSLVADLHVPDLVEQREEIRKLFRDQFFQWLLGIHDEAENLGEHIALREADFFRINSRACHDGVDQILLIFAIHDGEPARITESAPVTAQYPVSDRVECPAPKAARIDGQQIRNSIEHLPRSFIRERQQQNISGINSVLQ